MFSGWLTLRVQLLFYFLGGGAAPFFGAEALLAEPAAAGFDVLSFFL